MAKLGPTAQLQLLMAVNLAQPEPQQRFDFVVEERSKKQELKFLFEEAKHKQNAARSKEKTRVASKPAHFGKSSTPIHNRKGKF